MSEDLDLPPFPGPSKSKGAEAFVPESELISLRAKLAALEAQCAGHKGEILDLVGLLHRTADELRCNYPDWASKLDKLTEKTSSGTHLLARLRELEAIVDAELWLRAFKETGPHAESDRQAMRERLENLLAKVARQPTYPTHEEIKAQLAKERAKEMRTAHVPASLLHMPLDDSVAQQPTDGGVGDAG
jgi:hypothetical protein